MASKTKKNPRNKPATQLDVNKARREGINIGIRDSMTMFFTVMCDKEGHNRNPPKSMERDRRPIRQHRKRAT